MHVDLFLRSWDPACAVVEQVLATYPDHFEIRWHSPAEVERYTQLYLASLPLDATTGHALAGEAGHGDFAYGNYGYYGRRSAPAAFPALALFDRLALVHTPSGPPRPLQPGVWEVPFTNPDLLRGAFHQALEAALAELREAYTELRATHPGLLELPRAARLLHVTPTALRRALRRE